jgi:hypothetical protein
MTQKRIKIADGAQLSITRAMSKTDWASTMVNSSADAANRLIEPTVCQLTL